MIRTIQSTRRDQLPPTNDPETREIPYRFKMYRQSPSANIDGKGTAGGGEFPEMEETEAKELVEAVQSIDFNYLTFLLRETVTARTTSRFNILGAGDGIQQRKILKYLVCLRHGLERSNDISARIKFGKISHLVELLGRDERWPDRLFHGRCEGRSTMCQCDGEGKGCRTQRLFAVALMKLKMMQEDQALLKERFEIRYSSILELQMYEKQTRMSSKKRTGVTSKNTLGMKIVLPALKTDETPPKSRTKENEDRRRDISSVSTLSIPGDIVQKVTSLATETEEKEKEEKEKPYIISDESNADDVPEEETATVIETDEERKEYLEMNEDTGEIEAEKIEKEENGDDKGLVEEEEKPLERFDMAALLAKIRSSKPETSATQQSSDASPQQENALVQDDETQMGGDDTQIHEEVTGVRSKSKKAKSKKSSRKTTKTKKKKNEVIIENATQSSPVRPDLVELDLGSQQWVGILSLKTNQRSQGTAENGATLLSHIVLSGDKTSVTPTALPPQPHTPSIPQSPSPALPKQFPFKLEYSSDSNTWTEYKGRRGKTPTFTQLLDDYVFHLDKEINTRYLRVSTYTKDVISCGSLQAEPRNKTKAHEELPAPLEPKSIKSTPRQTPQPTLKRELTPVKRKETTPTLPATTKSPKSPDVMRAQETIPLPPERPESSSSSYSDHRWGRSSASSASFHITRDNDFDDDDDDDDSTLPSIQGGRVSKYDSDLVVNIKTDTRSPLPCTPIPNTKKKPMFPALPSSPVKSVSERDETAEERRRRKRALNRQRAAKQKLEAMKNSMTSQYRVNDEDEGSASEDEFGNYSGTEGDFLRKYCIISNEQRQFYKYLYNMYEEDKLDSEPALPVEEAMEAISIANNALVPEGMTNYIITMLRIVGLPIDNRVDLRTFMMILAFSEKVVSLGDFFRVHIERIDYPNLLSCMIRAKEMYKLLLRESEERRTIFVDDLFIELQAAQVPHNKDFFKSLRSKKVMMDFLDYLAYFPLFILTHTNIIASPVV